MKKILVVGSINMDLVMNSPRMPRLGETLHGEGFSVVEGGKGANQAVSAARLGCDVCMLGAVGADMYGDRLLENLSENRVLTEGVSRVDGSSGVAVIAVVEGDNFIILEKGANGKVDEDMILQKRALIESCDIVVMQFEIPMEAVMLTARLAHEAGKTVIVNPAPVTEFPHELYGYTDIFIPNHHEAGLLLGRQIETVLDGERALLEFVALGVKNPLITMGELGCVFYDGQKVCYVPAYKVKAVDSTGAGDSFIGGLCAAFSDGKTLTEAVKFATAVSAVTVMTLGASPSFPTRERVSEFLKEWE
jgi:ribokinase